MKWTKAQQTIIDRAKAMLAENPDVYVGKLFTLDIFPRSISMRDIDNALNGIESEYTKRERRLSKKTWEEVATIAKGHGIQTAGQSKEEIINGICEKIESLGN